MTINFSSLSRVTRRCLKTGWMGLLASGAMLSHLQAQDIAPQARLSQETPSSMAVAPPHAAPSSSEDTSVASFEDLFSEVGEQQIVVSQESFQPLSVSLGTGLTYSNNASLSSVRQLDDWTWTSSLAVNYQPKLTKSWILDFALREDFYRYDRFKDTLDFDAFKTSLGLLYFPSFLPDTFLFGRYSLQITTQPWDWDEALYLNQALQVGAQRHFYFSKGNLIQLMLAGEFSLDTNPELLKRNEYVFQVAHALRWTPNLQSSLVYRLAYNDYVNYSALSSWNQIVSARVQYAFTSALSLALTGSFIYNEANHDRFDYEVFTSALTLDLQFKF